MADAKKIAFFILVFISILGGYIASPHILEDHMALNIMVGVLISAGLASLLYLLYDILKI